MNHFFWTRIMIVTLMVFCQSCHDDATGKIERRKMGKDIIEAKFFGDSIADGPVKYYDNKGVLQSVMTFKNGIRDGYLINFFPDGRIRDSMQLLAGKLNGDAFTYDSIGRLLFARSFYFGISVGYNLSFRSGVLNEYTYKDFNKKNLVTCEYDSNGKVLLRYFNNTPAFVESIGQDKIPVLDVLIYLPHPPQLQTIYKLGVANEKLQTLSESILRSDQLFLDTSLQYPPKGLHYTITSEVRSIKDSINKIFIYDLKGY